MLGTARDLLEYSRLRALTFAAGLAALIALALPALAGAATTWFVESAGDAPKSVPGAECETADEECTFRAAIEAANVNPDRDTIKFDISLQGQPVPTIVLGSALPPITHPLRIDATPCEIGQGPPFPCVPIEAPAGSVGIDVTAGDTAVEGLIISGAEIGIRLSGIAASNLVEGNEIKTPPLDDDAIPISIRNGPNEVYGNEIEGTCCLPGIYLQGNADGNKIGGDTAQSENVIDGFQNGAIGMMLPETSRNEVGRNRGSSHSGFIGLFKASAGEPGFPNQIDPPVIGSVTIPRKTRPGGPGGPSGPLEPARAAGTAEPGAKVRLFRKATEDAGEIEGFLGEATADGSGNWSASIGTVPAGTFVAATQTFGGGTSELSETATASEPGAQGTMGPGGGGGTGGSSGSTGSGSTGSGSTAGGGAQEGQPAAVTPPAPRALVSFGPSGKLQATTARFRFSSSVAGSRFQCRLDGAKFSGCRSPRTYRNLKPGKHVFRVRAVGPTGLLGPVAKRAFTVS